jgi:nitronate monooxygenase
LSYIIYCVQYNNTALLGAGSIGQRPFTGRAIANAFTHEWRGRETDLSKASDEAPRYAAATADFGTAVPWAGEGADFVKAIEPAAQIVDRIVTEARAAIATVTSF